MLLLTSTSDKIRINSDASAASGLDVHASYIDASGGGSTITPGRQNTKITTSGLVDVVGSPAASTQRTIKNLSVHNVGSFSTTLSILHTDGSTEVTIYDGTLGPGELINFGDSGWSVFDSLGNIKTGTGSLAAGGTTQIQFNDGGTYLGGDAGLTYDKVNDTLSLSGSNTALRMQTNASQPTSPPAGSLALFSRAIANRALLHEVGPSGLDAGLQPLMARNKIGLWLPPGNATTTPGIFGLTAPTVVGTATARNVATTNLATRMRRLGYVSAATAGALAESRIAVAQFTAGSGVSDGSGFFMVSRFVPSNAAAVSGERFFIGMTSATGAATNVEPSTQTNTIGIAQISTDATQWYVVYGGSAAQTAIACGTALGRPDALSTVAYELAIFAPQGVANTYYLQVTNLTTGATFNQTLTGDATIVPQNTTLLTWKAWKTNNATALAVGFDIASLYIETDT